MRKCFASGISPELTEFDTLQEEISEKEEASEAVAAGMVENEKNRLEKIRWQDKRCEKSPYKLYLREVQKLIKMVPNAKSEKW